MTTKLTLALDDETVSQAKKYAKAHDTSLSKLVENYFRTISSRPSKNQERTLGPITQSLMGMFKEKDNSKSYREVIGEYLEEKYK